MPELNRCIAIYPPMLDVVLHTEKEDLVREGYEINTIVAYCKEKHKKTVERVQQRIQAGDKSVIFQSGGATFNTQKILSKWMECDFFGIVGKDAYGEILEEKMQGTKVHIHLDKSKQFSTPWAFVFITGDERTMIACQDANVSYSPSAKQHIFGLFNERSIFYFVSFTFFLNIVAKDSLEILMMKKEKGFFSLVNLSSEEVVRRFRNKILSVIKMSDFVIGNRSEFYELFGEADDQKLVAWLDTLNVGYAITDGPDPISGRIPGGPFRVLKPIEVHKEINTNGAGDAFAAGFIGAMKSKGFVKDKDILPLLTEGIRSSYFHIQRQVS
ncbi:adenosine kinase [Nematocida sp. AWRm80]|nr:adenosine kinase [Nematocida sp. AWRm80]